MMTSQLAIARFLRDVTLGMVLNALLLAGVFACFVIGGAMGSGIGDVFFVVLLGVVWLTLGYQSLKGSRLAAGSPQLIAAGQFDLAEYQIEQALRSFSLFRTSKLLSLHHLAVLRHAQKRWPDAAELCSALLRQRLGALKGLSRQSRLILAESLLELGDLHGAYGAISGLYADRLTLAEAMKLLAVQLDYLSRVHAWEAMLDGLASKVQLAELMNTPSSARSQALLALAAAKTGRTDWSEYLRKRVELLMDVGEMVASRPVLAALWPDAKESST
ncbi:MAG: hypothetical protein ABIP55_16535 [Tepidisphaeraceae bacterium]